ncbi:MULTISPECIES: DUF4296 domain-containing protein [Aequorivita]|uniref:DUF4296 domain-containing protein n=1 Tax=Aequorivita iocasae TaxID=2803865 RepID=A0ABX7DUA5_9FLAO|nr:MULTISPECIES: DUF4296 domain-containing protein [Aequorivita]QQX77332.1 DUF4296 domain-containing protein [Aequorivita iocasae]UCA56821.1 DUF4296 domain-containing protein [Aequorivita sp. F7]
MKHLLLLLLLALSFIGCQNVAQPEKPKDLISKEKMVDLLTEAYLANAARSVNNQAIIDKGIKMDSLIYKNFGVDSLQFANSNAYYAADVNTYMEIFQKVEARLVAMQKKMDSIREVEKNRKDTIEIKKIEEKASVEPVKDSLI